jgi:phosphonopyruvate decarboxylase
MPVFGISKLVYTNYRHIVFNNGAHESVGGQPTCAFGLDIDSIATGCQYKGVWSAETEQQINAALTEMKSVHGPSLLEIKINTKVRDDLGRPTIEPVENKINFIKNLQK